MARARTVDENRNQTKQLWIGGNAWGGWPSFAWFAGGRIVYQQVLAAGLAFRNDSVFCWLEDAECLFFPVGLPNVEDSDSCGHLQSDHISIAINCLPPRFSWSRASPCTGLTRWQYFNHVELFSGGRGGLQRNQVADDPYGACGGLWLSRFAPALETIYARRVHATHCHRHQRDPCRGRRHAGPPIWTRSS